VAQAMGGVAGGTSVAGERAESSGRQAMFKLLESVPY